jgi:DNA-binding MarR family transcriptional regulator
MKKMKSQRQGGFLIAKIHQLAGRIFARKLKEYDIEINPAQGRIMFVLWRDDGITINELAKKTQLGKSTLTSMLDRLEEAGYLERAPWKGDRRKIEIRRTAKDRAIEAKYVEVSREMTKLFYKGLSKSHIDRFETDLAKVLKNLTDFEAESR